MLLSGSSSDTDDEVEEASVVSEANHQLSRFDFDAAKIGGPGRITRKSAPQSLENVRSDPGSVFEETRSPSTEPSSGPTSATSDQRTRFSSVSTAISTEVRPLSQLPQDIQFYLHYHQTHLSFHHYFFKQEASYFLHTILIEQAVLYDPLLYAVAGFAAFHCTVKRRQGQIQDFLEYYNQSVSLLRRSLANGETYTDRTMLTILQLATFEVRSSSSRALRKLTRSQEYLGDWVSLLSHQQAAFRMLLQLYDTSSIIKTELHRTILAWYLRFDLTGSIMSGHETTASRNWFTALANYYHDQVLQFPDNIDYKIEAALSDHRVASTDMATLFARFTKGDITRDAFKSDCDTFRELIDTWRDRLDPIFRDDRYVVKSFDGKVKDPNDIVDPYEPGGLYRAPLSTFNFMIADWVAIRAMFRYKKALALQEDPPPELPDLALELCRIFEAIEHASEIPPEALLKAQAHLGVASLFLPKDDRHMMWCRRKLAKIENLGYLSHYPRLISWHYLDRFQLC